MNTISSIVMHMSNIDCIKIWVIAWADKCMKNDWAELKQQDVRTRDILPLLRRWTSLIEKGMSL